MANQFLVAMTLSALAIGLIAIVVGALCRAPSVRNLVWNAALLACAVAPIAWTLGPRLTIQAPATFTSRLSRVIDAPTNQGDHPLNPSGSQRSFARLFETDSPHTAEEIGEATLVIWLSGVLFFFIRFGRQLSFATGLVHRGTRATHKNLDSLLATAESALGIRIDVKVLESAEIDIPIATGILRPTILLPAYANEWPADELHMVLLHELAHVRRADILARAAAMVVCGLHWFNPVVWLLSRFATRDAELAADDLVLRAGVRPSSYADTLLNLADSVLHYPNAQPAMSLARRALLADRVHAILRESRIRREIGDCTRSMVLIGSCAGAMVAACVRFSASVPTPVPITPNELRPQSATPGEMGEIVTRATMPAHPRGALKSFEVLRPTRRGKVDATPSQSDSSWIAGATDGLIAALDDPSPQVRGEAAHALGRLGALRAQQSLNGLLNDPDKFVQYEARRALSELDRSTLERN